MASNKDRARMASRGWLAIELSARGDDPLTMAYDTITDILHYVATLPADDYNIDVDGSLVEHALRMAEYHYDAEKVGGGEDFED